jgi:ribosomal protein S24E
MRFEIVEKTENPLLKRIELKFKLFHEKAPTPRRVEVKSQIASALKVPEEFVIIEKLASLHGKQEASGIARVYDSKKQLEALEPRHLLMRGLPKEKEEKPVEKRPEPIPVKIKEEPEKKPEAKPEAKPEEKPPEKPPEEKPEEKVEKPPAEEKPPAPAEGEKPAEPAVEPEGEPEKKPEERMEPPEKKPIEGKPKEE